MEYVRLRDWTWIFDNISNNHKFCYLQNKPLDDLAGEQGRGHSLEGQSPLQRPWKTTLVICFVAVILLQQHFSCDCSRGSMICHTRWNTEHSSKTRCKTFRKQLLGTGRPGLTHSHRALWSNIGVVQRVRMDTMEDSRDRTNDKESSKNQLGSMVHWFSLLISWPDYNNASCSSYALNNRKFSPLPDLVHLSSSDEAPDSSCCTFVGST